MELTKIGPNTFEDTETKTTFTFLMHDISVEEAERRAYAMQRQFTDALLRKYFFGRSHNVHATGDLRGHPGFPSEPSA